MDHIHNFHKVRVFKDPIHRYERQRRQGQLTSAVYAALLSAIWERPKGVEAVVDFPAHAPRSHWIIRANIVDYMLEVGHRIRRPADFHLRLEHLFKTNPDFLMAEKISVVEPAKAGRHFPPEPGIVVQIILDKLPDVVV
jgi:hypothetical protein